ncbi:MAG: hypothetical protein IPN29_16505 [Saprospiraceae bacterium]|nr:hypothetical protein [Saprospiraceae bacterium]
MKRIHFLILFTCLLGTLRMQASLPPEDVVEVRKKITKTFDAPQNKTISADNRYGKITVVTYSGQQVKYDVDIIASASSKSKAQEELDRVSIVFEDQSTSVSAATEIGDKSGWFNWSWSGNVDLEINYTVYVPDHRKLKLTQKYGNILLPVYNGPCTLVAAYGNIEASDLNANYDISIRYGNGRFGCIKNGNINLRYSDITASSLENANVERKYGKMVVEHANKLTVVSKYSNYTIGSCATLNFDGGYDQVNLRESGPMVYENKYGELDLGTAIGNITIIGSYHSTAIKEMKSTVTNVNIEGSYGNVSLSSTGAYSYYVDGKYITVKEPSGRDRREDEDGGHTMVKGSKRGNGAGPNVNITGNYNTVVLR